MATIAIGLAIVGYISYLIIRKTKNMKAGRLCSSCAGCALAKNCEQFEKDKKGKQIDWEAL